MERELSRIGGSTDIQLQRSTSLRAVSRAPSQRFLSRSGCWRKSVIPFGLGVDQHIVYDRGDTCVHHVVVEGVMWDVTYQELVVVDKREGCSSRF
jgi:hypothetical protein